MKMNRIGIFTAALLMPLAAALPAAAQAQPGEVASAAQIIVTAQAKGSGAPPVLEQKDVTVLLKNKPVEITQWTPLQGSHAGLQLVFLFDNSAPPLLSLQFPSLRKFIQALPPSAEVGIAYMSNGRAQMAQTLTSDHALAAKALRLPNSIPGVSASPYFCLSNLAKNWPSKTRTRRVVFMVTNGEDPYYTSGDLQDPYVQTAISDSQKAGLLVYSIYFRDKGMRSLGSLGVLYGQSYLLMVSRGTGGQAYTEAMVTPVSFDPFLKRFKTSLANQYRVGISAQGKGLERVKVTPKMKGVSLAAPSAVDVGPQR